MGDKPWWGFFGTSPLFATPSTPALYEEPYFVDEVGFDELRSIVGFIEVEHVLPSCGHVPDGIIARGWW